MIRESSRCVGVLVAAAFALTLCSTAAAASPSPDSRLAAARKFVDNSERYLHHSKLSRGMKGYGLTVMAGTKPIRFEAEIVSVMTGWGPHQDVILARLSGLNLEKTMIISGMSGSPVFVTDPADGKDKIIGAVAYGWKGQNDPICGIQPITQMLAVGKVLPEKTPETKPATQPTTQPKEKPSRKPAVVSASKSAGKSLSAFLAPEKLDFATLGWNSQRSEARHGAMGLQPLSTPVMISGLSQASMNDIQEFLAPRGLRAVQAGGIAGAAGKGKPAESYVPGGAIAVALVTGDANWTALGTVTDVLDDKVIAFGHSFFAEGEAKLPIAPGYVHTVISGILGSFKLGAGLENNGMLVRDEQVGIAGQIGPDVPMIPLNITVSWDDDGRKQSFRYNICKHDYLTVLLANALLKEVAWGWRELPTQHHVAYDLSIDFGKYGVYKAANLSNASDVGWVASDLCRPIRAMMDNPLGPPADVRDIRVNIHIRSGDIGAQLVAFDLDAEEYYPGELITGKITLERYRQPRIEIPVKFNLPDTIEEGDYVLQANNWDADLNSLQKEQPHKFDPKTPRQLLESIQQAVVAQGNGLYLRLRLPEGGLALQTKELPDIPVSKALVLAQAKPLDAKVFGYSVVQEVKLPYVLEDSAAAKFKVVKHRSETKVSK